MGVPMTAAPEHENEVSFWEYEVASATSFTPNLKALAENGTSVEVMTGKRSRDSWYARMTIEQQEILGCPRMVVPGPQRV